jgi:hypothetical protein
LDDECLGKKRERKGPKMKKYAVAAFIASGVLLGMSVQAAPTSPAFVQAQAKSADAVQKVRHLRHSGSAGHSAHWSHGRWGPRRSQAPVSDATKP